MAVSGDGSRVAGHVGRAVCPLAVPDGQDSLDRMISVQAKAKSRSALIWLLIIP